MSNISIQFAFKCMEYREIGCNTYNAFKLAENHFKRSLTGIVLHKRKESLTKVYFFSDSSSLIYDNQGEYFNFKS